MDTIKELLHRSIDQMTESEAKEVLRFADRLQKSNDGEWIQTHQSIELPDSKSAYAKVSPLKMNGVPASSQLVSDRR